MQTTLSSHPNEELLERYALERIPEQTVQLLEEHLLFCELCRTRLGAVETYFRVCATAASDLERPQPRILPRKGWSWLWRQSEPVWISAFGAIVLLAALPLYRATHAVAHDTPSEIALESSRGAGQALIARAPAGKLILKIDASELPALASYRMQIVDGKGREVWTGTGASQHHQIRVAIPSQFSGGQYWVRLYDSSQTPIRELGFEIQ